MHARNLIARLFRDQSGATAIEYGLILALIVIALIGVLQSTATGTIDLWMTVSDTATSVMGN